MKENPDRNLIYFTHTFREFKPEYVTEDEYDVLTRVNQKIASRESLDETMNYLFDETLDTFKGDRIGLAFVVEDGERIQSHWAKATYEPLYLKHGYTEDLAGSSLEDDIKKGYIRVINDFEDYISKNTGSTSTKILLQEGVHSSITVPLKVENKVVAVLFRSSREKHAFDLKNAWKHLFLQERLGQAVEKTYLVKEYLDLSRIEGGNLSPAFQGDVNFINDVVEPVIDIEKSHIDEKNIKLTRNYSQDSILVQCDSENSPELTEELFHTARYVKETIYGKRLVLFAPLTLDEFKIIKQADIGTYQLFQETYHRDTYKKVHPKGEKHCDPNALSTFLEYLIDYGSEETRKIGEELINTHLEQMDEHPRKASEKMLERVREGKRLVITDSGIIDNTGVDRIRIVLVKLTPEDIINPTTILSDLINPGDLIIAGVPVSNYGLTIAFSHGLLERLLSPFKDLSRLKKTLTCGIIS